MILEKFELLVNNLKNYRGTQIYNLVEVIFPFHRSLTGSGVRKTLAVLRDYIQECSDVRLSIHSIQSGTKVFDWVVPEEWSIETGYIEDENGVHIIDMKDNNLHILGYSISVDKWVSLEELLQYIYTQSDQIDAIPYVTSFYKKRFGFCMSEIQKQELKSGQYHMVIKSSHKSDGVLNYAETIIKGKSDKEVLLSTYICHPSMANNECSGPALCAELIRFIASISDREYTYRILFIPETIGSISYLATGNHLSYLQQHLIAGFVISCVGDNRDYSMVSSKYANTLSDKLLNTVLNSYTNGNYKKYSFLHRGSDERQYNASGVNLPVVGFCRSKYGTYAEYHTSKDDMSFVSEEGFQGSYEVMTQVIALLECNNFYKMKVVCEPQLGKRGLYPTVSQKGSYESVYNLTNFIAYADGNNDLLDIINYTNINVKDLLNIVKMLIQEDLLEVTSNNE